MINRLEVVIIVFWQVLLIFNVQQLFPIFLHYMPSQKCDGTNFQQAKCYDVTEKCNKCVVNCQTSLCHADNKTCFDTIKKHDFFYSAADEYGHFCNPNLKYFRVDTLQYVGVLIGAVSFGFLSDVYGRRQILLIALSLGLFFLFLSGQMNSLVWFYICRFAVGLFNGAGLVVGWSYVSELIPANRRMLLRVFSSWPFARLIMTFVCWATGEWRLSTTILVLITAPLIPTLVFLLPESHVWLATKGRRAAFDHSVARLNWISGVSKIKKSDHTFTCKSARVGLRDGLTQIFAHPLLRKRMLVLFSFWFVTFYANYILDLNSDTMYEQNFFVAQFTLCGLLVATKLLLGLMDHYVPSMNRRKLHLSAQAAFVFFVTVIMVLYFNGYKGSTGFMLVWFAATISIELCSDVCYLIVNELMPTEVRGAASGASSMVARLANIASTFTTAMKDIFEPGLYINVIVISLLNWFVSYFFLDETKGADLKDVARDTMTKRSRKSTKVQKSLKEKLEAMEEMPTPALTPVPPRRGIDNPVFTIDEVDQRRRTSIDKEEGEHQQKDPNFWKPASNPNYSEEVEKKDEKEEEADDDAISMCNAEDGTCSALPPPIVAEKERDVFSLADTAAAKDDNDDEAAAKSDRSSSSPCSYEVVADEAAAAADPGDAAAADDQDFPTAPSSLENLDATVKQREAMAAIEEWRQSIEIPEQSYDNQALENSDDDDVKVIRF